MDPCTFETIHLVVRVDSLLRVMCGDNIRALANVATQMKAAPKGCSPQKGLLKMGVFAPKAN
jgi:hypothetical protein